MSPAVVAVDDEHFWHHGAVDPPAIGRALLNGVAHPGRDPGGSTLTQQLAKVLYSTGRPARSPSWARSASPSSSSTATRRRASSPCTSTASTFGPGHWGIARASRGYFGTSPDRLTWSEATLLAGLP